MKTTMLTRTLMIALFLAILSATTYAAGPVALSAKNLRQKLVETFQQTENQPGFPTSGVVEILFTLSDDGKIEVEQFNATNDKIAGYVKKKIASVEMNDFFHPYNQHYRIKLTFSQI
ncbi:MAG: hypothetical protein NTU98_01975 [Bacteroidetes bacterium]|nr:hypothetical protein [Bacteroidota bacterium]